MTPQDRDRIKLLFEQVAAMPLRERNEFLRRLAHSDPESHQAVQELLTGPGPTESFVERPSAAPTDSLPPGLAPAKIVRALQPGVILNGRFEVTSFLGAGGMGEVFRVFDRELHEWVALKTLRADSVTDETHINRLKNELQLARRVTHENVCRLLEMGRATLADGRDIFFFTMELLEGAALRQRIRQQPFSTADAEPVVRQLIAGLGAAHDAGVVHRDFKSSNVILATGRGGKPRAVITDFGLARRHSGDVNETLSMFGAGMVAGTPAYMAPEQFEGKVLTPASDVHALGVVMFEMLTGKLPFPGDTPLAIALQRLHHEAPSPREFVKEIDPRWESAILACLERDPAARPQSAAEVLDLLTGARRRRGKRSRRWFVGAGATVAVATAGMRYFWRPAKTLNPEAERELKLGQTFVARRTGDDLNKAVQHFKQAIALEPKYAAAWAGLGDAYSALNNFGLMDPKESLRLARNAAETAVRLDGRVARAQGLLGYVVSIDLKDWLNAEQYFRNAVRLDPRDTTVRLWYGAYLGKRGRFDEAIAQLKAGLAADPSSFLLNEQLATEYFLSRRWSEFYAKALELNQVQPYDGATYLTLARALEWQGRYDEALRQCESALQYKMSPPLVQCFRATVEASRGNRTRARQLAAEVEDYWRKNPFETILLVALYSRLEDKEEAFALLDQGYERDDSSVLVALTNPYLDILRSDPRWPRFAAKLGVKT